VNRADQVQQAHASADKPFVCRPDGKVAFGFSLFRGKRSNMEDFHHAQVRHKS